MDFSNVMQYVWLLLAIIVGFLVVKKVASCLIRTVVLLVLVALVAGWYFYLRQ